VNVWILSNERAGEGHSAHDLRQLVERAGHTLLGVAKQYDDTTPLPSLYPDLVVAAGGDGTVSTAAAAALKTSAALAILPLGTANNIATSLGVSAPVEELVAGWATARRVPFDLGHAEAASKHWLVVEGVGGGLVPAGIEWAKTEQKVRPPTSPSHEMDQAVWAFHDALLNLRPEPYTLVLDGDRIADEFLLLEVLNIRSIGPNLVFEPAATPSDGYFEVVTAEERHREELLMYLRYRAEGRSTRLSLPSQRAREISIDSCQALHVDDERVDTCALGSITVKIEPGAIDVLL
jgi:diacylglycerol kinase family enzyme